MKFVGKPGGGGGKPRGGVFTIGTPWCGGDNADEPCMKPGGGGGGGGDAIGIAEEDAICRIFIKSSKLSLSKNNSR